MENKTLGLLALILSNVIFGFSFMFTKVGLTYADPMVLMSLRFSVAFLVMNILLLIGKGKLNLKAKPVGKLILLGFIQPVVYFIVETYGIQLTSSSFAGIIIGLMPIFGLIFSALFFNEKIKAIQYLFVILSVTGVYLTTTGDISTSVLGTVLLFCAVLLATTFSTLTNKMSNIFSPFERTYMMFLLGFVCFTVMALVKVRFDLTMLISPLKHFEFIVSLGFLGVVASVVAFFCVNFGLSYIKVYTQTILSNLTTVVSIFAGVVFLKDFFTASQILGVILILISVFGVSIINSK